MLHVQNTYYGSGGIADQCKANHGRAADCRQGFAYNGRSMADTADVMQVMAHGMWMSARSPMEELFKILSAQISKRPKSLAGGSK